MKVVRGRSLMLSSLRLFRERAKPNSPNVFSCRKRHFSQEFTKETLYSENFKGPSPEIYKSTTIQDHLKLLMSSYELWLKEPLSFNSWEEIHNNSQYALISAGPQKDPIYNVSSAVDNLAQEKLKQKIFIFKVL